MIKFHEWYVEILTQRKNEFVKNSEMREEFCFIISVTGHNRPNIGKGMNEYDVVKGGGGGGGRGGGGDDDDDNDDIQLVCVYRILL
jgi:hypothetical protein